MSKIAAVLPAITPKVLLGLGLTAAGTLGETAAQNRVLAKQDRINRDWMRFQRDQQARVERTDAERRGRSYEALGDYLTGASQPAREAVVQSESDRLFAGMAPDAAPPSVEDALGAPASFGSKAFRDAAGRGLAEATREARERMRELATLSAYGGTTGGLATTRANAGIQAGQDIGFENEMRLVDADTLRRWQSVQPEMLQYESTGLGDLMAAIGGNVMGAGIEQGLPPLGGGRNTVSGWTPGMGAPVATQPGLTFGYPTIWPNRTGPRLRFGLGVN